MSVYVGIDVHRKRSQVAVVTEDGTVELNKNVVNGSEPMLRVYVPKTSSTSCDQTVFIDRATRAGLPSDAVPAEIDRFG
jgi:hypothetical protein